MTAAFGIRPSRADDMSALAGLYRDSFPAEDLRPLVADLLALPSGILSLVGCHDASVVGHVVFTTCSVEGCAAAIALLGPLAVRADFRRCGLGSTLVREGLALLADRGFGCVCVLGDPGYYSRFGFAAEAQVCPPYDLPTEYRAAWQSLRFAAIGQCCAGRLSVPAPWRCRSLWMPEP